VHTKSGRVTVNSLLFEVRCQRTVVALLVPSTSHYHAPDKGFTASTQGLIEAAVELAVGPGRQSLPVTSRFWHHQS
jgi:hypothetical protein